MKLVDQHVVSLIGLIAYRDAHWSRAHIPHTHTYYHTTHHTHGTDTICKERIFMTVCPIQCVKMRGMCELFDVFKLSGFRGVARRRVTVISDDTAETKLIHMELNCCVLAHFTSRVLQFGHYFQGYFVHNYHSKGLS